VFFDAVGTLLHPEPPAAAAYAAVGRRHGSRLDAAAVAARFAAAFRRQDALDRAAGWRTDEAREVARWRSVVAETLPDAADPEACFAELFAHFALPDAWRTDAHAPAVLEALTARSLLAGVASNFDERLHGVLAGAPGLRLAAGRVVVSAEAGWRKPAPEFFAAVCRAASLPSEEIVYIGDDLDNDYDGARAAGLSAVLIDPSGRRPDAARVARLADLPALLG
jgi:putative hydrolase of the HAD superfamily